MNRRTYLSYISALGIPGCLSNNTDKDQTSSTNPISETNNQFSLIINNITPANDERPAEVQFVFENVSDEEKTIWSGPLFPFSNLIAHRQGNDTAATLQLVPTTDAEYAVYETQPNTTDENEFTVVPEVREGDCWNALNGAHVPDQLIQYNLAPDEQKIRHYYVLSYTADRTCSPDGWYDLNGSFHLGEIEQERIIWDRTIQYPF